MVCDYIVWISFFPGEDAEGSSSEDTEDDYPSSYEKYKKRVTKELKIDNSWHLHDISPFWF